MTFQTVDIGEYPGDGTGDSLRVAFNKINQNFQQIVDGEITLSSSGAVTTVAGRDGDVILTVNDVLNAASKTYVTTAIQTADTALRDYTDYQITQAVSSLVSSAPTALDTLKELSDALGQDANFSATVLSNIAAVNANVAALSATLSGDNSTLTLALETETADRTSAIAAVQTSLNSEITRATDEEQRIEAKVDAEINRATDAETALTGDIAVLRTDLDSEVEDRAIADSTLQSNLDSAVADLQAADANIESLLSTEISNRDTAVNTVQSNLDAETQARTDADTDLQTQINNILNNTDPDALDSLTEIVDAFQAADGSLTATVGALQTSLSASIATVQSNLDTEQAARIAADDQFGSDLMSEAAARYTGDTTLQNNIDAEATARQTRDSQLETGIDNVAGSVTALATRVTAVETDKASITYVDDAIAAIPATDFTGYATETYVDDAVSNLVNSAPGTLDTLNELAAALGDDANFSTTITNLIADVQSNVDVISTALASKADSVDLVNAANWDSAYSWGDHSLVGYVKSVGGELPDANGDVTVSKDSVVTALQYAPVSSVNGVVPSPSTGALVLDLADFTDTTNLIPTVPTAVSQLDNDAGYLTADDIAVDTGNFTFSSNTLGVSDTDGGITINANGAGEIVMSDNVGVKNANPGYALHIGSQTDSTVTFPESIGMAISFGDIEGAIGGEAALLWDWSDGAGGGSNPDSLHARFGIFKDGSFSSPWLTFDQNAPSTISIDSNNRFTVTDNSTPTTLPNANYGSTYKTFEPWGTLLQSATELTGRTPSAATRVADSVSNTEIGHSFSNQITLNGDMLASDRFRGMSVNNEVVLNGYTWDGYERMLTMSGATSSISLLGSGQVGHVVGGSGFALVYPSDGTINITGGDRIPRNDAGDPSYNAGGPGIATGLYGAVQVLTDPSTSSAVSTVDIAAAFEAIIMAGGENSAITTAVGLYLPYRTSGNNYWARTYSTGGGAAGSIGSKYSILSEDPNTVLRNYGNIETNGQIKFANGLLTFKVVDVPTSSVGQLGDLTGMTANDASYHYYCAADYDGVTNIWKRVAWAPDTW